MCTATKAELQGRASVQVVAAVTEVLESEGTVSWSVKQPKYKYIYKVDDTQYDATINGTSTPLGLPATTAAFQNPPTELSTALAQYEPKSHQFRIDALESDLTEFH